MVEEITPSRLSLQPPKQEGRRSRYLLFPPPLLLFSELPPSVCSASFFHSHTTTLADKIDFPPSLWLYLSAQTPLSLSQCTHTHTQTRCPPPTPPRLTCSLPLSVVLQPSAELTEGRCWSSAIYTPSCLLSSLLLIIHEGGGFNS